MKALLRSIGLLLPLGLAACFGDGPPEIGVVAVEASRNADGKVHLSALVQNGGPDEGAGDFNGSFCVSARWKKGAKLTKSVGTNTWTAAGGTVIGEATACGSSLSAGTSIRLELTSPQSIQEAGVFAVVAFSDTPADSGAVVSSPGP